MEQRIRRVAIVVVASALLVLALPLGWALQTALFAAQRSELERAALAASATVSPDFVAGDAVELPATPQAGTAVALYDAAALRRTGTGPATGDPITLRACRGTPADGSVGGELVVAVPISARERTIGAVRAASSLPGLWLRVALAWGALLVAVTAAFAIALYVARRQARSLAAPLEALARAATAVTAGDLSARAEPAGITEIDEVARAQNVMVERLLTLLRRERSLGTDIAHQLRTPLTRLQLILQSPPPADRDGPALAEVRTLQTAVDDLLASTGRPISWAGAADASHIGAVIEDAAQRWRGLLAEHGRPLRVQILADADGVAVPPGVTRQVLEILLDNASRHGRGAVTVRARDVAGALAVDVGDEGTCDGEQDDPDGPRQAHEGHVDGHGIGLTLASDLAASVGGRLVLTARRPTTFTLLLPEPVTTPQPMPRPQPAGDHQQGTKDGARSTR